MEQSSQPFGRRLSDVLGVTADRARRVLDGAMRWGAGDSSKGDMWEAQVGRYIRFHGGIGLDDAMKAQVRKMVADRLDIILGADNAAMCMLGDGTTLPANDLRADLSKWLFANGSACPKCDADLLDWEPDAVLYSDPLQVRVHCVECGHRGYRVFVTPNVGVHRQDPALPT